MVHPHRHTQARRAGSLAESSARQCKHFPRVDIMLDIDADPRCQREVFDQGQRGLAGEACRWWRWTRSFLICLGDFDTKICSLFVLTNVPVMGRRGRRFAITHGMAWHKLVGLLCPNDTTQVRSGTNKEEYNVKTNDSILIKLCAHLVESICTYVWPPSG
jgi:hypothetical protein